MASEPTYTLSQAKIIHAIHELIVGPELRFSREDCRVLRLLLEQEAGTCESVAQNKLLTELIHYFEELPAYLEDAG